MAFATREYKRLLKTEAMLMTDIEAKGTSPRDRAACARALDTILERKRIMRMKPKPKDVDVSKLPHRARVQRSTPGRPNFTIPKPTEPERIS